MANMAPKRMASSPLPNIMQSRRCPQNRLSISDAQVATQRTSR